MKKLFFLLLLTTGCERNPVDRLTNPLPNGQAPQTSASYTIFDSELFTGGGIALVPAAGNQFITVEDTSQPRLSSRQIKYVWNGGDAGGQHLFAGFSLILTPDLNDIFKVNPKDLRNAGYNALKFSVRGELSPNTTLRIEGPDDAVSSDADGHQRARLELTSLTSDWQEYSLFVPNNDFNFLRVYVTFSFQFEQAPRTDNPGAGGTVYLDDIRYE